MGVVCLQSTCGIQRWDYHPRYKGQYDLWPRGLYRVLSYTDHTDSLPLFLFSMQVYNLFVYMSVYLGRLGSLKKGLHFLHLHILSNLPMPSIHQGLSRCLFSCSLYSDLGHVTFSSWPSHSDVLIEVDKDHSSFKTPSNIERTLKPEAEAEEWWIEHFPSHSGH